jgi:hypothetical protein
VRIIYTIRTFSVDFFNGLDVLYQESEDAGLDIHVGEFHDESTSVADAEITENEVLGEGAEITEAVSDGKSCLGVTPRLTRLAAIWESRAQTRLIGMTLVSSGMLLSSD